MKKTLLFVFLLIYTLCFASCSKSEIILSNKEEGFSLFYCTDNKAVISLLTEKDCIDDDFDWKEDVLNSIDDRKRMISALRFSKEKEKLYEIFDLYRNFSNMIVDYIEEASVKWNYKNGYYLVIYDDYTPYAQIYIFYMDFKKGKEIIGDFPIFLKEYEETIDSYDYLNLDNCWYVDLEYYKD